MRRRKLRLYSKLAIIGVNLVAAVGAFATGHLFQDSLAGDMAASLAVEHRALIFLTILFVASNLTAWHYRASSTASVSRMLVWAVIAYLAISHAVDLLGNHHEVIWQILGLAEETTEAPLLTALRVRLLVFVVILGMAITSIAVGFESAKGADHGSSGAD